MIKQFNLDGYSLIDTKVTSSKGNQQKWLIDNFWYKADHMGYEALCEVVVSRLLKKSNINNYVEYNLIRLEFDGKIYNGCYSENFKKKNESLITLEYLAKQWLASSMAKELTLFTDVKDRIKHTVDFIEKTTKLENVGEYITTMLELDAFFLNEDRHTNNIAFILNDDTGEYRYCPYFDFGLSLLADTAEDYPLGIDTEKLITKIYAKPFDRDFDVQLDCAQELYGEHLKFSFTNKDIEDVFKDLNEYYSKDIINRVKDLLYNQKHKYQYMFVSG